MSRSVTRSPGTVSSSRGAAPDVGALREAAFAALDRAYAPYSGFGVGAAIWSDDGRIFSGCNVENASYPACLCAERAAVAAAVAGGASGLSCLVVASDAREPTPPCGVCRQVLAELAPDLEIISRTRGGAEARWKLSALLPHPFSPQSLDRS
ncbi:MAG: cytidine deaminase [Steroidobacteraceae bacterium]